VGGQQQALLVVYSNPPPLYTHDNAPEPEPPATPTVKGFRRRSWVGTPASASAPAASMCSSSRLMTGWRLDRSRSGSSTATLYACMCVYV
jgi:hypothetical protein